MQQDMSGRFVGVAVLLEIRIHHLCMNKDRSIAHPRCTMHHRDSMLLQEAGSLEVFHYMYRNWL
jgi:hypothetical protein